MINLLKIDEQCITLLGTIYYVRELIKIVCILVPIGLIVMLTFDFFKAIIMLKHTDSEKADSEIIRKVVKRLIYAGIIFLVPYIVFTLFDIGGIKITDSNSCWAYANEESVETIKKMMKDQEEAIAKRNEARLKEGTVSIIESEKRTLTPPTIPDSSTTTTNNTTANGEYMLLINPSHQTGNGTISKNSAYNTEQKSMYILAGKLKAAAESAGYATYITNENDGTAFKRSQVDEAINAGASYGDKIVYIALHSDAPEEQKEMWGPQVYHIPSNTTSKGFATSLCSSLEKLYKQYDSKLSRPCMQDNGSSRSEIPYYYQKSGKGAAVLIEIGYHDSNKNQTFIEEHGEDLAKSMVEGINDYLNITPGANNTNQSTTKPSKLIFVGDSRTEGMYYAVKSKDIWSYKSSMGLKWMKSTGVPNIESKITKDSALIILMGVNDVYQPKNYIEYLNGKVSSWTSKGAKVYFVSVNPCTSKYKYCDSNKKIKEFNQTLKSGLDSSIKYIDTYSYLQSNGFTAPDGLHYNNETYKKIYNYIKSNL